LTPRFGAEKRRDKRLVVKLPVGLRLPDGSEETTTTENISKSGMCFACNLELQIGDRVYVSVGTSGPGEEREIPARVVWRRPARDKGRAFYGVKLEGPHEAVPAPPSS
jgi:Tfp pilus assembly protein PilZ